ncbi:MAG: rhomboid family intramembrane serine protease [Proteobacteria bacterium]|nr:rhomboid family intramembrane serine protease [Pseudomonadota bacterium]
MIPLRDSVATRRVPVVNYALIALCALAFLAELRAGPQLDALIQRYALIPAHFTALSERIGFWSPEAILPLFSSMFLHAGLLHFGGNMLFLWIFGDNVEDRFGHLGYALFYLAGGAAAGVSHVLSDPGSIAPTIGASGAVAAVMGAYFMLHPGARIQSLLLIGFFVTTASVPAVIYLALWFGMQVLMGATGAQEGVAWWAHAGGFAFGCLAVVLLGRRSRHG